MTYVSDRHSKQSFSVVVGGGKTLGLLELLGDAANLVGDLVGLGDVTVGGHAGNHHLQHGTERMECGAQLILFYYYRWLVRKLTPPTLIQKKLNVAFYKVFRQT